MAKKAKGKAKKGKAKGPEVPEEWVGKSVEELRALVAELEENLSNARKCRNKAQVEHASIQSYYDATREQIRELEMRVEAKDLEIENAEEDGASELRVYEQKKNFLGYCQDMRLREAEADKERKMEESAEDHEERLRNLDAEKGDMRGALDDADERRAREISDFQKESQVDLRGLKEKLDANVERFEQECDDQHAHLREELDSRRTSMLKIVESRKEAHLKDLADVHRRRCEEMRSYFEKVERQQQIDIEDLEAEIRRMKKAAERNEASSDSLRESNETSGEELRECSEKVSSLEFKTRDKEKHASSLRNATARLVSTRKAIREAMVKYERLQEKFDEVEAERNRLRAGIDGATNEACKADATKQDLLDGKLREQDERNAVLEQHLEHIVRSAGLDAKKSELLQSSLNDFVRENDLELEKLNLAIAKAKKSYDEALQSCRSKLMDANVSMADVESIDVLGKKQNA